MVPLDVRILRIYDESAGTAFSSSFPATLRDLWLVAFRPFDPFCLVLESVGTVFFRIFRVSYVAYWGSGLCSLYESEIREHLDNLAFVAHKWA
jgi:hypothetical protein